METAIYITEVARKDNAGWIEEELRRYNDDSNPGLYRMALKMATGTGKTVVMAMMIAWQTLNKLANPQDRRFADAFLVVAPGITIRDRLRVLLPNNPNTIAYVNSAMSRARFYAVELVKFSGKDVSAFETRTVWRPAVAGIRDGQDKVDEETFLAGVDDPVYRESLRESLEFCRGLGLRFPWGPAGTSIRIQTIDKAERSRSAGYSRSRDLLAGLERIQPRLRHQQRQFTTNAHRPAGARGIPWRSRSDRGPRSTRNENAGRVPDTAHRPPGCAALDQGCDRQPDSVHQRGMSVVSVVQGTSAGPSC